MNEEPMVVVDFRADILQHFDVPAWNDYMAKLTSINLVPGDWAAGSRPPPLVMMLDFSGLRRAHYHLDGIDLRFCWLEGADFSGASLRDARMGCCRNARFVHSRLHRADFRDVEISGADFSGAYGLDAARFEGSVYWRGNPPAGLPDAVMAVCKPDAEPPPSDGRHPRNPREPQGHQQSPLRCAASIHLVPGGE